jgi:peroxiredoxin
MEEALLTVALLVVFPLLAGVWFFVYQLFKQQGRLLLRLDSLEQRLGHAGGHAPGAAPQPQAPQGLPVGTEVADFQLADLDGRQVSLSDFRGRRVLLVSWNPTCGYCDMIGPDLAQLQKDFDESNVKMVLASYGDADSNRKLAEEHGLEAPVLLLGSRTLEAFQNMGTPCAYLLDENGIVIEPMAVGANAVPLLARSAAARNGKRKRLPGEKPLSESKIPRGGLPAGTLAPAFTLPDLGGRLVSLDQYRGGRVLLVFSDPSCGPCDQLAPKLAELHRRHTGNGLSILMVGRGDAQENRRKAREFGLEFPVVMQDRWKLSKEYGIFATPVAFLIGKDGVIERNVAEGPEKILALAANASSESKEVGHERSV